MALIGACRDASDAGGAERRGKPDGGGATTATPSSAESASVRASEERATWTVSLREVAASRGLDFRHENGFDGRSYRVVETIAGGLALLDANGDGRLDVYFTNGRPIRLEGPAPRNALFLAGSDGRYRDASVTSGADDDAFSLGCAVADVDGDGRPDLHVTNDGPNRLYRGLGDGRFEDIAPGIGLAQASMDTGAAFLDFDGDGDLDLFVASYVIDDGSKSGPLLVRGAPSYWPPLSYPAAPDHLYENRDGVFVDISETSGIRSVPAGRGLGVLAADLDDDGHIDLYVANDMSANHLWLGDGTGKFREAAFEKGAALGSHGEEQGSMGLALGDLDGDRLGDLCVTNYQDQRNNLFRSVPGGGGEGFYEDLVQASGTSIGTLSEVSWGVAFADLDLDAWDDLVIVNGHLNPEAERIDSSTRYAQTDRVHRNLGGGQFEDVTERSGEFATIAGVGRGAAFGDLDRDGDLDLVIANSGGAALLWENASSSTRAWSAIELVGRGKNRDAIGASVELHVGARVLRRWRHSASSYLSAEDPCLHFGAGDAALLDLVEVRWPDGTKDTYRDLPTRQRLRLEAGVPEARPALAAPPFKAETSSERPPE